MSYDAFMIVVLAALGVLFLEVWWICECSGVNEKIRPNRHGGSDCYDMVYFMLWISER